MPCLHTAEPVCAVRGRVAAELMFSLNVLKSFPGKETKLNETSAFMISVLFRYSVDGFHFKCIHKRGCTRVHAFKSRFSQECIFTMPRSG